MALTKAEVEAALNLKWFGAKWDGVTDDSKALEKAIEASVEEGGVPILLPPGTGIINSMKLTWSVEPTVNFIADRV